MAHRSYACTSAVGQAWLVVGWSICRRLLAPAPAVVAHTQLAANAAAVSPFSNGACVSVASSSPGPCVAADASNDGSSAPSGARRAAATATALSRPDESTPVPALGAEWSDRRVLLVTGVGGGATLQLGVTAQLLLLHAVGDDALVAAAAAASLSLLVGAAWGVFACDELRSGAPSLASGWLLCAGFGVLLAGVATLGATTVAVPEARDN